jgi:hypothetical protein
MLGVTARHLLDFGTDKRSAAGSLLPGAAALLANGQRHLIVRSTRVGGATEDMARHE